ncbi:hypothetical protein J2N86_13370 [Legionella lytica]|uniref:Coiled-coil protein n=1 Tax=Legionella lytica TaxID=96232 RepID=A0ABY4Y7N3_9GAMM|nr:hypothetical protein [Legionella lytica]USQ13650.1 hypothetical protein J2N86_13370 [Legionella lytica]
MAYTKQEPKQTTPYTKDELKSLRKEMVALKQGIQLPHMAHGVFAPADISLKGLSDEKQGEVYTFIKKLKTSLIAHGADISDLEFKPENLQELCSLFSDAEKAAKASGEDKVNPENKSSLFCCFR